ncbi:hypothetical protein GFL03_22880 [Pseudomonas stutzeri]|nr:hypothetical protein [Stutzerimonas frequens]
MLFAPALADRAILPKAWGSSYFFNRIGHKRTVSPINKSVPVSLEPEVALESALVGRSPGYRRATVVRLNTPRPVCSTSPLCPSSFRPVRMWRRTRSSQAFTYY